ncbi:hypothetical protein DSECCO2_382040 [anaerobic digester metagenome]
MPRMAFMGVRISWLILARNSLLERVALSASSLAWRRSSACWRSSSLAFLRSEMSSMTRITPRDRSLGSMALAETWLQNTAPFLRRNWYSIWAISRSARRP